MRAGPMRHRCMHRGYIDGGMPSAEFGVIWASSGRRSATFPPVMYEAASQMQVTVTAEINIRYHWNVAAGQHTWCTTAPLTKIIAPLTPTSATC